ncbi:hypothetical protein AB0392_04335 [Nonomuraea angiospora]|uniref:hypothetical protein n=1 Tax=Nonomuraea angiospora TaxID=46172 RepID=UPI00344D0713
MWTHQQNGADCPAAARVDNPLVPPRITGPAAGKPAVAMNVVLIVPAGAAAWGRFGPYPFT